MIRSQKPISSKKAALLIALGLSLLGSALPAAAATIEFYVSPPGIQASSRPSITTENFDSLGTNALPASGNWAVGAFTATSGKYFPAGQYGGAGGAGNYLSVSSNNANAISVLLNGDRRYIGFWWSAGDSSNRIDFYDAGNNLLASFDTASLVTFLSPKTGSITAIDGGSYSKNSYYGNPNPPPDRVLNEPYAYVNLLISGTTATFKKIVMVGTGFELDNLTIANNPPIDSAWVNYGSQPVAVPAGEVGTNNDTGSTAYQTVLSGSVASNDVPVPNATFGSTSNPAHGVLVFSSDGTYSYTPSAGFSGIDSFTYQLCKPAPDAAQCAPATVTIAVGPSAQPDTATTPVGQTVGGNVAGNDVAPGGSRYTLVSNPRGIAVLNFSTGAYTYSPQAGFAGTDQFTYRICLPAPNQTLCSSSTVTVSVNAPPVAANVAIAGQPRAGVAVSGSYTYGDVEGDNQGISIIRWASAPGASGVGTTTIAGATGASYVPTNADVGKFLFYCVTPVALTGATLGVEVCSSASAAVAANAAPVAGAVEAGSGGGSAPATGTPLVGSYTYADGEGDTQGASQERWVASASTPAAGTTVATTASYTPVQADVGRFLFFCVTPVAASGASPGAEVCSPAAAAVVATPVPSIPTLSQWSLLALSLLMATAAAMGIRRRAS